MEYDDIIANKKRGATTIRALTYLLRKKVKRIRKDIQPSINCLLYVF